MSLLANKDLEAHGVTSPTGTSLAASPHTLLGLCFVPGQPGPALGLPSFPLAATLG